MLDPDRRPKENFALVALFCGALLIHFSLATQNWRAGFMPGHEFRQTQTALVSYYIDQNNDFSLLYQTPILGKPWVSILLEVPLYEWSVVGLSRLTGATHVVAARTVTLSCFYLTLPALYLLLGRFALRPARRLFVLALVLTCPVYIFYSRAFLMESMEVMFCAWFLLGFLRTMDDRRWRWVGLATVAGTGAALVKSSTLAVWLVPAASYAGWQLVRDLRGGQFAQAGRTALWGVAPVVVPLASLRWWIGVTDPIKAAHASAWIFTSKNLSVGNWGLADLSARFSGKVWGELLDRWQDAIMAPWLVGLGLAVGLGLGGKIRGRVAGLAAVFFLAQLMFPFAYTYQDYYFYACAVFLLAALGFMLLGLLDSKLGRWVAWPAVALFFGAQLTTYWTSYREPQLAISDGGFNYTVALREIAPADAVLVVAGADWAAVIPYYAQRKALMIRNGLEYDRKYLERAFADLSGENACILILVGATRENRELLEFAAERMDLDRHSPTFSQGQTDVYFSRPYIGGVRTRLRSTTKFPEVHFAENVPEAGGRSTAFKISPEVARSSFAGVSPAPFQGEFSYGFDHVAVGGADVLTAHPEADLWLVPPPAARTIHWDFGINPGAYEREGDKTDGVEFSITVESVGAKPRLIYSRLLDPAQVAGDRGLQREAISYVPAPGDILKFSTRRHGTLAFDWAYWSRIAVE